MGEIIKGVLPFVGIVAVVLVSMVVFPQIITWLPGLMFHSVR
jgi:TRAP-type mannitol/chloroaromatic compound transport system permease large subunit